MSLATLKKKSHVICSSHSDKTGFSLNGCLRPQGYIGQTSLSRTLPRTLAGRTGELRGYGGRNVNNLNPESITSGLVDYNDNTVVKPSVKNTFSMIRTKHMGLLNHGNEKPPCSLIDTPASHSCSTRVDDTSGEHTRNIRLKLFQSLQKQKQLDTSSSSSSPPIIDPFLKKITKPHYMNYKSKAEQNNCPNDASNLLKNTYFDSYEKYLQHQISECNFSKIIKISTCKAPIQK